MQNKTRFFKLLGLSSYFGLIIWMSLWYFLIEPENYSVIFVLVIFIAPLLFPAHGLITGKPYTYAWANFIVMIYVLHGFTAIYTEDNWLYPLVEIILSAGMFVGCAYYARLRGRELGLGLKKKKNKSE
jgi:uncharacterized membrane protein